MNGFASSVVQETRSSAMGINRACSNGRSRKNECSGGPESPARTRREEE